METPQPLPIGAGSLHVAGKSRFKNRKASLFQLAGCRQLTKANSVPTAPNRRTRLGAFLNDRNHSIRLMRLWSGVTFAVDFAIGFPVAEQQGYLSRGVTHAEGWLF